MTARGACARCSFSGLCSENWSPVKGFREFTAGARAVRDPPKTGPDPDRRALDENGRWFNESGPLAKRSIIKYLNRSIAKDDQGFYVTQLNGKKQEKVYFPYVETALFAVDINLKSSPLQLKLNTGKIISLDPNSLLVKNDRLYLQEEDELIKFSEHALVKLSKLLVPHEKQMVLLIAGVEYFIHESSAFSESGSSFCA